MKQQEASMADQNDRLQWETEDDYWSTNYRSRPYA